EEYSTHSVIISTGAKARWIGLENETKLQNRGVSACATCDGFFFRDQDVCIVGGGDTAMEEALYLAGLCKSVTVIHRRDELRASKIMQDRALKHPKINFFWNTVVTDVFDVEAGTVNAVELQDTKTGEKRVHATEGLFIAIGHTPNTTIFGDALELDDLGYLVTKADTPETNISGVFASGDVQDHVWRQAITAAGTGCMAAIAAERWLSERDLL
ncbi:MAG: thioredoxin-disulfide reductase, partial [Deltaproteobacteria bacterium]